MISFGILERPLGQSSPDVIQRAAEALGGQERIQSVRTLTIEGYGQTAPQNGGANASASVDAPQLWTNFQAYEKTIDLENERVRIRQRSQAFTSTATLSRSLGNIVTTQVLDGDIDSARRNGSIVLFDSMQEEVTRWNFEAGWPSNWKGADLDAGANDVAVEEVTIAHEGLVRA